MKQNFKSVLHLGEFLCIFRYRWQNVSSPLQGRMLYCGGVTYVCFVFSWLVLQVLVILLMTVVISPGPDLAWGGP